MNRRTSAQTRLILSGQLAALIEADLDFSGSIAIQAPGGYGKSAILRELTRRYDSDRVLLIDDAHLLDESHQRELRNLVEAGQRSLVVAYRPWPRPPALVDLADAVKRHGHRMTLSPFNEQQTADYLSATIGFEAEPETVEFVHAQTGGVPRFVERLAQALSGNGTEVPQSAVIQFGPDLEELDADTRRLLLAAVPGVELPVEALTALLSRDPDDVRAQAKASGLLGQDNRLPPIVQRAVALLSAAAHRDGVWRRLVEVQVQQGGPVLPIVRSLHTIGVGGGQLAMAFETAADEALTNEPALAAQLFAAAAAAGRPTGARQALAAVLSCDLDAALRLADRLIADEESPDRSDGAAIAATALAHRGQLGRSAELYRWSGTASSAAFAAISSVGTGHSDDLDRLLQQPPADGPPTLLAGASLLMARGVKETLSSSSTAAMSTLVQASALLEPGGEAALLPDSPAALAALVGLHCGELDIGEAVLERAIASGMGAALMSRRHRLLRAWILMMRGKTSTASEILTEAAEGEGPVESRDLLFATALEVGIARRNSDLPALQHSWVRAREAVMRQPTDLFSLLPLCELAIAAARIGELGRLGMHLQEARVLLERLGNPTLWATPLHWSGLHAAMVTEDSAMLDEQVAALTAARHTRYGSVMAAAAESWLEIVRGTVDPVKVEAAARGLQGMGLTWDAARLAGQAAIRTSDRRAMTALLDCARMLQGRPAQSGQAADALAISDDSRLSEREQEVADLVLAGLTYRQIGDQLFISAKTVEHHVARIRQRLNCASRGELLTRLRSIAAIRAGGGKLTRVPWPRRPT